MGWWKRSTRSANPDTANPLPTMTPHSPASRGACHHGRASRRGALRGRQDSHPGWTAEGWIASYGVPQRAPGSRREARRVLSGSVRDEASLLHLLRGAARLLVEIHRPLTVAVSAFVRIAGLHRGPDVLRRLQARGLELFARGDGAEDLVKQLVDGADLAEQLGRQQPVTEETVKTQLEGAASFTSQNVEKSPTSGVS
jgi:hypothetical protein